MPHSPSSSDRSSAPATVSPNNPCPFLRALVAERLLADDTESMGRVATVIASVAKAGDGAPSLPAAAIYAIASIANGLNPLSVARGQASGLRLNALRDGPLDKHGVGSAILNAKGGVTRGELSRLNTYASDKTDAAGNTERGLDLSELRRFMDANFERAAGRRRRIDRALMDGEWPVLLKVMGKDARDGRYLSVAEVGTLFTERRLPARMMARLPTAAG